MHKNLFQIISTRFPFRDTHDINDDDDDGDGNKNVSNIIISSISSLKCLFSKTQYVLFSYITTVYVRTTGISVMQVVYGRSVIKTEA
jgi:hypothetical protein